MSDYERGWKSLSAVSGARTEGGEIAPLQYGERERERERYAETVICITV